MQYKRLGNSDLQVSAICLGTMTFGEQNNEAEAHAQLDYALANGVNFIDTAEIYPVPIKAKTQGMSESIIGNWMHARGNRQQVILASKVAGPAPRLKYLRNGATLEPPQIKQAITATLKRLRTDYLDLYQIHWPARNTNYFGTLGYTPRIEKNVTSIAETLSALKELIDAGWVRCIGVSNETPWGVQEYRIQAERQSRYQIVSIQNPYNLLNRSFEVGLAEIADREKIGLMAYSPLGFGALSGKYLNHARPKGARLSRWEEYFARYLSSQGQIATSAYVELAKKHGILPAQMAIAFALSRPFVTSVIVGATTSEQLAMNIDAINCELNQEVEESIQQIYLNNPHPCP